MRREDAQLTYLVNESCIRCKTMDYVEVCPVDCFYEGENNLAGKGTAPERKAYAERTALRWPKIPLVSTSLKCEVRTADTSSMPKSFAAATCPWLSLQGNDRDDSRLVGVLR